MEKERKRKMEDEGEEDEDEQIEKFYALIRRTKDMHDRLRNGQHGSKEKEEERKVAVVWNPTFRPEDFMEDAKSGLPLPTQAAGPSSTKEQQRKEEEDEAKEKAEDAGSGLDLKLSL